MLKREASYCAKSAWQSAAMFPESQLNHRKWESEERRFYKRDHSLIILRKDAAVFITE